MVTYNRITEILERLQGTAFELGDFLVTGFKQFDIVWLFFIVIKTTIVATLASFVLVKNFKLENSVAAPRERKSSLDLQW